MDTQELEQAIFTEPDSDLSEHVQRILSGEDQVTLESLIDTCYNSTLAQQRLINNSCLSGDNIISLALINDCEQLFKCIVEILAAKSQAYKPLRRELMFKFRRRHHFTWIAKLEETEIKWMLRSCIEAPAHDLFVSTVVREMSDLGRDLNIFLTGYSPVAHVIQRCEGKTYRNLMRTDLYALKTLDGEPLIFQTVECGESQALSSDIQRRLELWNSLINEKSLIEGQYFGTNLFTRAIEMNDIPLVDYLLKEYRGTLSILNSSELPLIIAIKCGSNVIIDNLIIAEFCAVEKNKRGMTPLQAAFYSDCASIAEILLRNVPYKDIFTMDNLCRAMSAGKWWIAKTIFEGIIANCDLTEVFERDGRSYTALEKQIDVMTSRRVFGKGREKPRSSMLLSTWRWCSDRTTLNILDTDGRDWWHLS